MNIRQWASMPVQVMAKPIGPICNLDCEYCYYLDKEKYYPGKRNFRMDEGLLEKYVQQYLAAQPGPQVHFAFQGGEPTLMGLDFFRKIVEFQHKHKPDGWEITNALQTNGTLIDEEWAAFLRDNRFLIGISIDGPQDIHDHYRFDKGGKPSFEKVIRGLRLLQEYGVEYNTLTVVNDVNSKRPQDVYDFYQEYGIQWVQFIPIVERLPDGGVTRRSVPPRDFGLFLSAIFDRWVRNDVGKLFVQIFEECLSTWIGGQANLCVFRETCGRALILEHNGDLFSCDHFMFPEYNLGNINDTPLAELANSPQQHKFGMDKRDALPGQCKRCNVRFMCNGGCPKNRFTKDANGEDGLNYLCEGYYYFFNHVDPYMRRFRELWRANRPLESMMDELRREESGRFATAGRNDPCPCGSGKKYKKCCLRKQTAAR